MKKKIQTITTKTDLQVDLTFHNIPASLLAEFAEKIVHPYYNGNLNVAFQDLIQKELAEHNFVNTHISHVRNTQA